MLLVTRTLTGTLGKAGISCPVVHLVVVMCQLHTMQRFKSRKVIYLSWWTFLEYHSCLR